MYTKLALVSAMLAIAEARFGQEQAVANLIQGLGNFGNPGQAATLAGQSPGVLLAGANACAKLQLADTIVAQLGDDAQVIAVAKAVVAAEKNFNPFAVNIPSICSDASLPATEALRGIVPLVDPAVVGSDVENANSAASIDNLFNANGLSQADVAIANGFSNFTLQGLDGATADANAGAGDAGADNNAGNNQNNNGNIACGAPVTLTQVVKAPAATQNAGNNNQDNNNNNNNQDNNNNNQNNNNNNNNAGAGNLAGADFGLCTPTMDFVLGRPGRRADEGTFLPTDALVAQGQQEALNPNIITNRICDQLTNVCEANQAAKDACRAAQDLVQSLGTKDATTADAFNAALGF